MARSNEEVEALLREYADLLLITGGDAFRARAYEKAARSIGGHPTDVSGLDVKGLREIPNVGKSIAEKVVEYLRTGHVPAVEQARSKIPAGVRELTAIPALGPKKAMLLYEELDIASVEQLATAIEEHRLRDLKGFGPKSEENILHGIGLLRAAGGRVPLDTAMDVADDIVAALSRVPGCERVAYAGSLRRMRETVGDVDILVAAAESAAFMDAFTALPYTAEIIAHGEKKTSIRTTKGLQVDLRVLPLDSWGAGLLYFTGSKAHNIRVRAIAVRHGLKLSEYGLFETKSGKKIASRSEEDVYARLGMDWIPPTLREDRGEVKAALEGQLPTLISESELRGDLHTHTDLTDGLEPLENMIATAERRGYAYYAVTDHAPKLYMQQMTKEKILAQRERLRAMDRGRGRRDMRLLHGVELNIDADGEVDWPDDFLEGFDLCVASVHTQFGQDRDTMTRRFLRACENPHVNIIGHPTTRILGKRPGVDADLDAVFAACARTGTALEINAHPNRLDLSDENILRAKEHGVVFAIDSDAHSTLDLANPRYGVGMAQRAWLTTDDVINTWPLTRLRRFLRKGSGHSRDV
ncbi:DNA polymerase/3'-5' exonuclease PolX [Streptomyces sp. RTd22]|uniref:DNA polymerase/3'-5' exonuclease PolX n=1 Tax=Streptomyces sp. RTd22 TaxID=1841249 RepID=UPI0007C460C9|nr:DNA polymerase/3'-5' exonuclease PolX [Streptomyces sp. RTd22]